MTARHARIIALVVIVAAFAPRVRVHGQISIETIRARAEQADANVTITPMAGRLRFGDTLTLVE